MKTTKATDVGDGPHEVGHVGDVRGQAVDVVDEQAKSDTDQGAEGDHAPLRRLEAEVQTARPWRGGFRRRCR